MYLPQDISFYFNEDAPHPTRSVFELKHTTLFPHHFSVPMNRGPPGRFICFPGDLMTYIPAHMNGTLTPEVTHPAKNGKKGKRKEGKGKKNKKRDLQCYLKVTLIRVANWLAPRPPRKHHVKRTQPSVQQHSLVAVHSRCQQLWPSHHWMRLAR